jgi:cell division protein FtsA
MHGFRLDVETHVITAAATSIQNMLKCIRGVGLDIDDLVLEPLASSEAVLTEDEKQVGVILADIGGGTTDICIFKDGSIWHSSILPVAGYQLTRDIAIGLGLPFDVAEEMKKRYGSVMPVYESRMESTNPFLLMVMEFLTRTFAILFVPGWKKSCALYCSSCRVQTTSRWYRLVWSLPVAVPTFPV